MSTDSRSLVIDPPPDFPVVWQHPDDAQRHWLFDPMHRPDPMPLLEFSIWDHALTYGLNAANEAYGSPIRMAFRRINTYFYSAAIPPPLPSEELGARLAHAEQQVLAALAGYMERWQAEWEPELRRYVDDWRAFDLGAATLPQLIAHADETLARIARAWEIHFLVAMPMTLAMSQFQDTYQGLFGAERALGAYQLLQGLDNKSLAAGRGLWRLSQLALAQPPVHAIFETHADHEVLAALEREPAAQPFLAELRAYLDEFGGRAERWDEISAPSWIEDPTPAIGNIRAYMAQPLRDDAAEHARLAVERERRLAEVRAALRGYPQPVVDQFELELRAAQAGSVLQEDHNYWIDQRCMYEVRRVTQELGQRFAAAGAIERADDVIHLTAAEMRETAGRLAEANHVALVAERQAEIERFRAVRPPPALGTRPPGPPPEGAMSRAGARFWGGPPPEQTEPDVLRGNPGSPGTARGVARVLHSLSEMSRLGAGEILVTASTAPPWTPLFATAAAVVTDTGGVLSHCAVVAREYHIPAVVGVGTATTQIRDGMLLEVDGDAGTVRIIADL
ncbi:MAG TPA: PEP-utilizing enzyme [Roseiflexaceae bacterium]|nr:PEP-utilizing enzyme [Roseiflexaceae bacterium]